MPVIAVKACAGAARPPLAAQGAGCGACDDEDFVRSRKYLRGCNVMFTFLRNMRIFEKFWYGNIKPTEPNTSPYLEYKKQHDLFQNSSILEAQIILWARKNDGTYSTAPIGHGLTDGCFCIRMRT